MAQVKRRPLPTLALGTEPCLPGVAKLAEWVAERRKDGEAGDLTTFLLGQGLAPQLEAGIAIPCTGGRFYKDRLLASFAGVAGTAIIGETGITGDDLAGDAMDLAGKKKGVWCAAPAPHLLGLSDHYYGDGEEAFAAVADLYRGAMRAMRDAGVGGHVLICDHADERELAALCRQKTFFFTPSPTQKDLGLLLEFQDRIAVGGDFLPHVLTLSGEYDLHRIIIVDPDPPSIALALAHADPDQIIAGGYCTGSCGTYWKDLVAAAFFSP